MTEHLVAQTVLGLIPASELGFTLSHEHLLCDQRSITFQKPTSIEEQDLAFRPVALDIFGWLQMNWASNLDNLVLSDEVVAVDEAILFKKVGGTTLVDCTVQGLGRNPRALARIAQLVGINIIMGSGYYVAPTHPPKLSNASVDAICSEIVSEFRVGVDGTGHRAGVIGEIGSSWPMDPAEERVFYAAGMAQAELGCGLTVHPGRHPDSPMKIIDVLRLAGADISRVIISHIERTILDEYFIRSLADTGCFIEYDLFGTVVTSRFPYRVHRIDIPTDAGRIDQIRHLMDAGYGRQILMSHDVCTKHRTRRYGGVGYDHILQDIIPWMRDRGFAESELHQLTIDNPRRAFSFYADALDCAN